MAQAPNFGRTPVLEDVIPLSGPSRDYVTPSIPRGVPPVESSSPMMPPFSGPMLPQPQPAASMLPQAPQAGGPNFLGMMLPIAAAVLAGRGDPVAVGHGLAAFQKGRDLKRQEMESLEQREARKALERAEFYSRAVEQAQQIGDPIEFEQFKAAIAPYAEYHGISTEVFTFSDAKRQERDRKLVAEALATATKRHGDDIVNQPGYALQLADGRSIPMSQAVQMVGGSVTEGGTPVQVSEKGATPLQSLQLMKAEADLMPGANTPTPGSFEEYTTASPERRTQIEADRKGYFTADNAAPNSGVQDQRRFTMEQRLVAQWDKAETPFREMRRQLGLMETGLKRFRAGDTNGGAQAVLVTFQKILDPTSVVRESEYARTATGQSLINRIEGFAQRLASGGAGLTDAEMAAMVETGREFLKGMEGYNNGLRQRIGLTAKEYGLDTNLIFTDLIVPDAGETAAPAATGRYNPATGRVEPIQ